MTETGKSEAVEVKHLIVGAGPAGLQLSYFLSRSSQDHVVLERDSVASFFASYPRHRRLISNNKVHTGTDDMDMRLRWDWNSLLSDDDTPRFTTWTPDYLPRADCLVDYLRDFRRRHDLPVQEGVTVERISRAADGRFEVVAADGRVWLAGTVVVATGHPKPHVPDFEGVELCEQYAEISTDPEDYADQRVLIVGKGNSGFETASNIFAHTSATHMLSPHPVRLAWTTHHVSDLRATYNGTLDSYQLKMQNTILDGLVERVSRRADGRLDVHFRYSHANGQEWDFVVDRVVLCCGFRFDFSLFDFEGGLSDCHAGRWPAMSSSWESVDQPGLFFAGTLMQARDYKQSFSGFIHGFRYNLRFLAGLLERRATGRRPDTESLPGGGDAETITQDLLLRCTKASSLFQLPAFLADVYVLRRTEDGVNVTVRRDVPADYAHDDAELGPASRLVVTMEYGHLPPGADPFDVVRDPEDGTTSQFIHPVVRSYHGGQLRSTYHVPEDLENYWLKQRYSEPCRAAMGAMLQDLDQADLALTAPGTG